MLWDGQSLSLLNQTKLPVVVEYIKCTNYERIGEAIKKLEVRGAPAIGAAAAFAFVLGARQASKSDRLLFLKDIGVVDHYLRSTRPTAVNLFWALDQMMNVIQEQAELIELPKILDLLEQKALFIAAEDKRVNHTMAAFGAALFKEPVSILTHCNAGALATVEWGTALGVIRQAFSEGNIKRVFADETRPLLQGARLTAFELQQDHIPVTLITDNMAGWVMKNKMVDAVIVGADRIAANGDTANKIGTYSVALLAYMHQIPFYVAAPASTFDFSMATGDQIPIEERGEFEVTHFQGIQSAPDDMAVFNPAFDVTPNQYITGIITEYGVLKPNYQEEIKQLKDKMEENK